MAKQWGKPGNGPDWTDVTTLMSAIGSLHECRASLVVTADTQGHNGIGLLTVRAEWERLPNSELRRELTLSREWPTKDGLTFEGLAFKLLYELDFAIGQDYQQRDLPV